MEKLNEEQMEMVDGGSMGATIEDAKALFKKGVMNVDFSDVALVDFKTVSPLVNEAWKKVGVTCVSKCSPFSSNEYYYDGKEISRNEALNILKGYAHKI